MTYSPAAIAEMLAPGSTYEIATSARIYDQGIGKTTCCAHSVGSAMETRMVGVNGVDPAMTLIEPNVIFAAGKSKRSLHVSCRVAAKGVPTALGLERAATEYMGAMPIDKMVAELKSNVPLMVELQIGDNFSYYDGTGIYRFIAPKSLHAMCVIGYGTDIDTGEPYWIAKNSYGSAWGNRGRALLLWGDRDVEPESNVHAMRSVTP